MQKLLIDLEASRDNFKDFEHDFCREKKKAKLVSDTQNFLGQNVKFINHEKFNFGLDIIEKLIKALDFALEIEKKKVDKERPFKAVTL